MVAMQRRGMTARHLLLPASVLAFALLLLAVGPGVVGASTSPCKHGCSVQPGTYRGTNDQGKHVLIHVGIGKLGSGPHSEVAHVIDHFKTDFVVTCPNQVKSNVDTKARGTINGIHGHMYLGEKYMQVLWAKDEPAVGDARYKSRTCSGSTHFKLHLDKH
jgi:hypothetical protein